MSFIWRFLATAGIFVVIDAIWLTTIANKFYKKQLGSLLLAKPKFGPAVIFYALYVSAIVIFVLNPALEAGRSLTYLIGHAALLGLTMYATYDLTNLATLKKWPVTLTIVDLAWGTFITTIVSIIGFEIFR
jgi:uncharacterized membrane protein